MGGKGGGGDSNAYQPQPSTIDTNVAPIDLSQRQESIDVAKAARDATAPPELGDQPAGDTTGDVAARTLDVPDYLTGQHSLQPLKGKKSKLITTEDSSSAGGGTGQV